MVGYFFEGFNLGHIAEMQASFILRAAGLTSTYSGHTPDRAHENLPPILPGHFDRRLMILKETLKGFGLDDVQIQTWVDFEDAFRPMIVKTDQDSS